MCCRKQKNTEDNLGFIPFLDAIESALEELAEESQKGDTEVEGIPIDDLPKNKQIKIYKDLVDSMSEDITNCLKGKDRLLKEIEMQDELILAQKRKIEELEGIIDEQGSYIDELEDENYDLVSRIKDIAEVINKAY